MATAALGSPYVLSDAGASVLVEMVERGSAPIASAGFKSRLHESTDASDRLGRIETWVRSKSSTH